MPFALENGQSERHQNELDAVVEVHEHQEEHVQPLLLAEAHAVLDDLVQ